MFSLNSHLSGSAQFCQAPPTSDRLRPVLDVSVDGVPAGVYRHEADQRREDPDAGVELPDEANADGVVVAERLTDGEVAVEADGEQLRDRQISRVLSRDVGINEYNRKNDRCTNLGNGKDPRETETVICS